jgi:hypothetical protein
MSDTGHTHFWKMVFPYRQQGKTCEENDLLHRFSDATQSTYETTKFRLPFPSPPGSSSRGATLEATKLHQKAPSDPPPLAAAAADAGGGGGALSPKAEGAESAHRSPLDARRGGDPVEGAARR